MQSALGGMPSGIGAGAGSDLGTGNNIAAAYSAQQGHGTLQVDPLALAPSGQAELVGPLGAGLGLGHSAVAGGVGMDAGASFVGGARGMGTGAAGVGLGVGPSVAASVTGVSMVKVVASTGSTVTAMPSLPRLVVRSAAKSEAVTSACIALALVTVLVRMVTFSVSTPARRRRAGPPAVSAVKPRTSSWTCEASTPLRLPS